MGFLNKIRFLWGRSNVSFLHFINHFSSKDANKSNKNIFATCTERNGKEYVWIIGTNKVDVLDKKIDKNGLILILDVMVDDTNFVVVNVYNPNTKKEQVTTLLDLDKLLETIKDFSDKI